MKLSYPGYILCVRRQAVTLSDARSTSEVNQMTAILERGDRAIVVEATEDDVRAAIDNALRAASLTYDELARQASTGRFATIEGRRAWTAIGGLGQLQR